MRCYGGEQRFYRHHSHEIARAHEILRVPAAAGQRGQGAGTVFSVRPHLHRGDILHQVACAEIRRGIGIDAGLSGHQPARAAHCRAMPTIGTSAIRPAFMWTPRRRPGRKTTGCTVMWRASCRRLWTSIFPRAQVHPEFSAIPWAAMARSRLALRNPQQYKSVSAFAPIAAPCNLPGAARHSAIILAPRLKSGASMTPRNWWRAAPIPGPSSSTRAPRINILPNSCCRRNSLPPRRSPGSA